MRKCATLILGRSRDDAVASGFAVADESVQKEQAKVKPGKLPKKGRKKIKLINTITTFDAPGTFQPQKAKRTILDLPKQIKVNTKAAKYCKTDERTCGRPHASQPRRSLRQEVAGLIDSGSSAQVRVGSAVGATVIPVDVVAFNEKGKKLLLYSKPTGTFQAFPARSCRQAEEVEVGQGLRGRPLTSRSRRSAPERSASSR